MTPPPPNTTQVAPDVAVATATGGAGKAAAAPARTSSGSKPLTWGRKSNIEIAFLWYFVLVPFLAFVVAVPFAWGWGLTWTDVAIFLPFYFVSGFGVTVGFHRYLTHGSFKTDKRWMHIALTVAGTMAIEGAPIRWVADHRRHHQFADEENDPHSPWRFGHSTRGMAKGMLYAHVGWLFDRDVTNARRFCPDLVADKDVRFIQKHFLWVLGFTFLGPAIIGGLVTMSWWGAFTAFFWAGLVRVFLVHHVTWSINSVCHMVGEKTFESRDQSRNFWPLAILSLGESWHNSHHADPTGARHGVEPGQVDLSARLIWLFEKAGWVHSVRWPNQERLDAKRVKAPAAAA